MRNSLPSICLVALTLTAMDTSTSRAQAEQDKGAASASPQQSDRSGAESVDEDGSIELPVLSVTGTAESAYGPVEGYKATRSATATKSDMAIIDVPASIQVVPREVITDQNAQSISDVTRNISAAQSSGTFGNRSEGLTIRGFSGSRLAKDGFLSATSFGDVGFLDLANVERIEVLKGPASVLYGQNEPGGLVNIVTKKPQPDSFHDFDATYGSYDFYRGQADLNRPLNEEESLLFRLNAAYQESGSFRDFFIDSHRGQIAPSLRWTPTEDTSVDLQVEYYDQKQQFDRGLVAVGDQADVLPRDRYLGEKFSTNEANELRFNGAIDHEFNENWSLRTLFRVADSHADRFSADPRGLQADGRTLDRRVMDLQQDIRNYAAQANLTGNFQTGFLEHELLLGVDTNFTRFESASRTAALDSIDIYAPVYGAEPGAFGPTSTQDRDIDFYGFYLQDLVSIGEHWKVMLGGRFDYAQTKFSRDGDLINDATDKEFSPRAGIVYQPADNLSLYSSYTKSFNPFVFNVSADGSPFEPEYGEQYEIGIKGAFFQNRLSATLSVFQLTRENVLTADPNNPSFSIQTGEQRSRGIELDLAGEIMPGWKVIASGAYIDAEITKDNTFEEGNKLANVPTWSGSLWSTYEIQKGNLRGLGFGGGLFAASRREGDLANSFQADGYVRADATVFYRYNENVKASLNVHNLFDASYIEAASSRTEIYPGAPRTVLGRLTISF